MHRPRVVVVGTGPNGVTFARRVLERMPEAEVLMVEAGPVLTPDAPGRNTRNIPDADAQRAARLRAQGPSAVVQGVGYGLPQEAQIEGTFTARAGTHLVDFGGDGSGFSDGLPLAALSTGVGGQGAHWTGSCPEPRGSERIAEIPDDEWNPYIKQAQVLLKVDTRPQPPGTIVRAVQDALAAALADVLPEGGNAGPLPQAGVRGRDGDVYWSGTDTLLAPVVDDPATNARLELRPGTICRRVLLDGNRATGVELYDRQRGESYFETAAAVVVAADAVRSPQLLYASGVRPPALGRYLTEHPAVIGIVAVLEEVIGEIALVEYNPAELPASGSIRVPFTDDIHPFSAQIMHMGPDNPAVRPDDPLAGNPLGYVTLGYGCRKHPRADDRIEFDDDAVDWMGMPVPHIQYSLTAREHGEMDLARTFIEREAAALGRFVQGGEPGMMPPGTSLHYQGTVRIGVDPETSVVDLATGTVHGTSGLYVVGNGLIPTATAANPTLTSVALTLRSADKFVESRKESTA